MNIAVEKYHASLERLPQSGQHIIAHQTGSSLIVYQAFRPSIAAYAVQHQRFGGPDYSFQRMSWIKPNFLWMMYRCGWARKEAQQRVLAIRIAKTTFDAILAEAVHSSYQPTHYETREEWKGAMAKSKVRLQWDPDHDPYGNKIERRAIQLGLKGKTLHQFATEQLEEIQDITDFVKEQGSFVASHELEKLEIPVENIYLPNS